MQIPRGYQKKSLLCRKSAILSIRWKKSHFGAFPEAQKANWRSQLHTQSSQMHSIPLGPSEKNSFCAKVQRKRDMCDPYGKNHILGHSLRLKSVVISAICLRKAAHWPTNNANPSGLSEEKVYCVESLRFCR